MEVNVKFSPLKLEEQCSICLALEAEGVLERVCIAEQKCITCGCELCTKHSQNHQNRRPDHKVVNMIRVLRSLSIKQRKEMENVWEEAKDVERVTMIKALESKERLLASKERVATAIQNLEESSQKTLNEIKNEMEENRDFLFKRLIDLCQSTKGELLDQVCKINNQLEIFETQVIGIQQNRLEDSFEKVPQDKSSLKNGKNRCKILNFSIQILTLLTR